MKTKVDIISGFLGAGKTTLIKKLLEEALYKEKVVIIENEFGEVGIDGGILKNSGIQVKEINSGCICCTLAGDFGKAVEEVIRQYAPDRLIIEPSGVGKLSDVVKACKAPGLQDLVELNMVISVIDVLKYQIYISNFGEFYENQVKNAKTVVLSRTQKADSNRLEKTADSIKSLNPNANIITTPWESIPAELVIGVAEQDAALSLERQLMETRKVAIKRHNHTAGCKCGCGGSHIHHHGHDHTQDHNHTSSTHNHSADDFFEVWGVETPKEYSEAALKTVLNALANEKDYGIILRAKGILKTSENKWIQFDYVPGEIEIKNASADYTGRLCVIGRDLKRVELSSLFRVCA
ncbi:putative GTP-binding protein YjiA [Ruminiclostridium hungatei]|uniref:Putative GTP-binding protein YjiA n=1 Tax=Ruminiclostridium hungatei TaxID=48256 RepID=A0A1V4SMK5_RUMHU|nr:GTP-binding protein [Ruminiclostridium hungatei]OPX44477.1 putative GTP-binding protein YjiA [Ruminiclostridium hungatei]